MKYLFLIVFFLLNHPFSWSQIISFQAEMDEEVEETSGLLYINNKIITHNDSGGDPILYEVDPDSGDITRKISINNATNNDWEDLSADEDYIYIADFGNNDGSRTDLKVYRISMTDFLSSDAVTADIINFNYSDQVDFTSNSSTNFDAETLINYHDSLYIFTKNRGDFKSNIYPISKVPGTYQISKIGTIDPQILVTGGTYDETSDAVVLTGYSFTGPYILTMNGFDTDQLITGIMNKYPITISGNSAQIEGIYSIGQNQFYVSAEGNSAVAPQLFLLDADDILPIVATKSLPIQLYPNPTSNTITIQCEDFILLRIYNIQGQLLMTSHEKTIDISSIHKGTYFVIVQNKLGQQGRQKFILD